MDAKTKRILFAAISRSEDIPCIALTAPDAGSDAGAITDTGIVCRSQFQGQEVLGIRLSWDKRYITLAPVATLLGLAIKLYDPDRLLGGKENYGITLCLIPTMLPGVEIGNRHLPLHFAFMKDQHAVKTSLYLWTPSLVVLKWQGKAGECKWSVYRSVVQFHCLH